LLLPPQSASEHFFLAKIHSGLVSEAVKSATALWAALYSRTFSLEELPSPCQDDFLFYPER